MADDVSKSLAAKLSKFRQGISPAEVSMLHFALDSSGPNAIDKQDAKDLGGKLNSWAQTNLTPEESQLLASRLQANPKTVETAQALQSELQKSQAKPASPSLLQKVNDFDLAFVASCHHPAQGL